MIRQFLDNIQETYQRFESKNDCSPYISLKPSSTLLSEIYEMISDESMLYDHSKVSNAWHLIVLDCLEIN